MSANRLLIRFDQSPPAHGRLAAIALVLFALAGCRSALPTAQLNPIDANYTLPPAETLDYPGPEQFWNKSGLVISPTRIVAQVGSEVPMFAGICDGKGQLAPHEQVEWMLDNGGVGSFVSVADPIRPFCLELVSSKARKVDNTYALTETSPANVILTRGTATLNDDMVMPRGYTWVTVTSPVEGSSYITAYGPDVYSWDVRQKSARIIWIDAEWCFPEAVCAKVGEPVTLTTCVVRRTTKVPVSDWIVKYCITGGVAAGFGPDNAQSVEIATGEDGRATVEVIPAAEANGSVCINVELIRSECATPGSPERLSIATAATQVTWGIPDPPPAPPPSVPATPAPANPPVNPPPSAPPATPTPPTNPPPAAPAPPAAPQIDINIRGPATADLGQDIKFEIDVVNRGATPAPGLVLSARFDEGLKHATGMTAIEKRDFGTVEPGTTKPVELNFRVLKSGRQCFTIEVTDLANLDRRVVLATKQHCVSVADRLQQPAAPAFKIDVTGPAEAVVGDQISFTITATNVGDADSNQVVITAQFDPSFDLNSIAVPQSESTGFARTMKGEPQWSVGTLRAKGSVTRSVFVRGKLASPKACCLATITDATKQYVANEACLILKPGGGLSQGPFKIDVVSAANPAKVNTDANYRISITNVGRESEKQVQLTVTLPPQMLLRGEPRANVQVELIEGKRIVFRPIAELRQNEPQPLNFDLVLRSEQAGDAKIQVDVTSVNYPTPLTVTKSFLIVP